MIGLTAQQAKLLTFITAYQRDSGVSPSFDQMCVACGIVSKSGIPRLLAALEERGHITRIPNRHRAIEILDHDPLHAVPSAALIAELSRRGEWQATA